MQHQNTKVGHIDFKNEQGSELCGCIATLPSGSYDSDYMAMLHSV